VRDALFAEIRCRNSRVTELDTKDAGSDKAAHNNQTELKWANTRPILVPIVGLEQSGIIFSGRQANRIDKATERVAHLPQYVSFLETGVFMERYVRYQHRVDRAHLQCHSGQDQCRTG
jgi:hypothetical protein